MNLTKQDAEKLINDSQFMSELGKCLNNKQLIIELLKKKGFEISEQEYEELLHSANKFSECSNEELKSIAGGMGYPYYSYPPTPNQNNITVVVQNQNQTTQSNFTPENHRNNKGNGQPMPAIGGVFLGSFMSLIGLGIAIAGTCKCIKDGPFAPF